MPNNERALVDYEYYSFHISAIIPQLRDCFPLQLQKHNFHDILEPPLYRD